MEENTIKDHDYYLKKLNESFEQQEKLLKECYDKGYILDIIIHGASASYKSMFSNTFMKLELESMEYRERIYKSDIESIKSELEDK